MPDRMTFRDGRSVLEAAGVGGESSERRALHALLRDVGPRVGLTDAAIDCVVTTAKVSRWRRGHLLRPGPEGATVVHVVVTGGIGLACAGNPPRSAMLGIFRAGQFFTLGPFPGPTGPTSFCAVAQLDSVVAEIDLCHTCEVLEAMPVASIVRLLGGGWRSLMRIVHRKCCQLGAGPADRLLAELEVLAVDFGAPDPRGCRIALPLGLEDIAGLAGVNCEEVRGTMEDLQSRGKVAAEGDTLVVLASDTDADAQTGASRV